MSVALDLGSSEFRSLRNSESQLLARRIGTSYAVLNDTPSQRALLQKSRVPFLYADRQLIVLGEQAEELSDLQNLPLIPLLTGDGVPHNDPIGRQVLAALIGTLLPSRHHEPQLMTCTSVLPGDIELDFPGGEFLSRVLKLHGYRLVPVHAGVALAISQLGTAGYTGLTFSFGAESTSCCLTHAGIPVWQETFATGARTVERDFALTTQQLMCDRAGNTYLDLRNVSRWLASGKLLLNRPQDTESMVIADGIRKLLRSIVPTIRQRLQAKPAAKFLPEGIPILAGGGMTRIPGFAHILYEVLVEANLPLQNAEIRLARPDSLGTCRGALILSLLNESGEIPESLTASIAA